MVSCSSGGGGSSGTDGGSGGSIGGDSQSGSNVLPVSVEAYGTGVCSSGPSTGPNIPCTQIKICQPGTNNCQTINNILVDTGSPGLRVFQSLISVSLTQTGTKTNPIAECAEFADGTAAWGPVEFADVILGGERASNVPIQVILDPDTNSNDPPSTNAAFQSACGSSIPLDTPSNSSLNGILGVSFFPVDSGPYFSCVEASCSTGSPTLLDSNSLAHPVQNPVTLLSVDNNGVILTFPNVAAGGAASVSGSLILGIGTQSNNILSPSADIYPAVEGVITTSYNGSTYSGFMDSGTNFFAIPNNSITECSSSSSFPGFFCPNQTLAETANNLDVNGHLVPVQFQIADANNLNMNANVFNDLGGPSTSQIGLIFGFPFFLGRTVYVGYGSAPGTAGPYFAY